MNDAEMYALKERLLKKLHEEYYLSDLQIQIVMYGDEIERLHMLTFICTSTKIRCWDPKRYPNLAEKD